MEKTTRPIKQRSIAELLGERKLILASRSPRRADILKREKVKFAAKIPPDVEGGEASSDPAQHVLSLSRRKATSIAEEVENAIVLGADTIVVLDGEILGKPQDRENAFSILKKLSGRTHRVYTGVTLVNKYNGKVVTDYDMTEVKFNQLDDEKIWAYIDTKEPMDKAGAYGIQGMGGFLVESIRGSLDNVIGLPTGKLKEMLAEII
ncbi:MAG: Maf family protein [Candidatus Zixiibacteriota bacterium]